MYVPCRLPRLLALALERSERVLLAAARADSSSTSGSSSKSLSPSPDARLPLSNSPSLVAPPLDSGSQPDSSPGDSSSKSEPSSMPDSSPSLAGGGSSGLPRLSYSCMIFSASASSSSSSSSSSPSDSMGAPALLGGLLDRDGLDGSSAVGPPPRSTRNARRHPRTAAAPRWHSGAPPLPWPQRAGAGAPCSGRGAGPPRHRRHGAAPARSGGGGLRGQEGRRGQEAVEGAPWRACGHCPLVHGAPRGRQPRRARRAAASLGRGAPPRASEGCGGGHPSSPSPAASQ
ncbi:unnamed protein product, partial [Prorocentrum cordatum]